MEHLSPGSSPGTNAGSLSDFEETAKINRWPVKSHVGPIKSIVTNTHARTTIDRIPPELLSKIFLVCAVLWPTQDLDSSLDDYFVHSVGPGDFTCGDRLPWIAIAQVCPYWRSVALACGELWRGLLFSSPEATKEMLRRSKGVTLIVKAEGGYNPSIYENVRTVIPDIGRVSVLHLCFKAYHLQALLRDISVAFPVLESLRLRAKSDFYGDDPPFLMPDVIFAGNSPSLRFLEFTNCQISWQSLLAILREVPMLDSLILDRALPTNSDIASPKQFPSQLRVLTLGGSVDSCTNLLAQIAYPIATIATFKCEMTSRDNPNFYNFLQRAHSAIRYGCGDHIIQSLGIANTYHCLILQSSVVCHSSAPVPSQQLPNFNVVLSRDDYRRIPVTEFMHAVVATLPLAEVQILYVSGLWQSDIDWSEFFQHLPLIHTIHFRQVFSPELMDVLA
jgi:hypothetical protein